MPYSTIRSEPYTLLEGRETYWGNVAIRLVLLASARHGKEEDDEPRNADLGEHFEIHRPEARVQRGTHKYVINKIAGHPHLCTRGNGDEVHPEGYAEPVYHAHGHEVPVVVDDLRQTKDASGMQDCCRDHRDVETPEGVAFVHEGLVSE